MTEKVAVPAADERGSKRRLRSIKRLSGSSKEGKPIAAPRGQKKAIRGNRLRQHNN
jgi:hypothetical protein